MEELSKSFVDRKGSTERIWSQRRSGVGCMEQSGGLTFQFAISSKGGGSTALRIYVSPRDFSTVLQEMLKADSKITFKLMSQLIAEHFAESKPPISESSQR